MPNISKLQERLRKLAAAHTSALAGAQEHANASATELYQRLSTAAEGEELLASLRQRLTGMVQKARVEAVRLAVAHVLAELHAVIGSNADGIEIPLRDEPSQADVALYVDNAVQAARDAMVGAEPEDKAAAFVSTAYRAHTLLTSESTSAYKAERDVAGQTLSAMTDEQARTLGFAIARSQEEFRSASSGKTRSDDEWIPLVGMRWSASSSACPRCIRVNGQLRPFGFSFSEPGPTVHANCNCITTLWAVAIPVSRALVGEGHEQRCARDREEQPMGSSALAGRGERGGMPSEDGTLRYMGDERAAASVDRDARTVELVVSTEAWDSYDTRFLASGCVLTRYDKNPIFVWCHNVYDSEALLGTASVRIEGKKVIAKVQFLPSGKGKQADHVFELYALKVLRGASIRFNPLAWEDSEDDKGPNGTKRWLRTFTKWELLELSAAPLPSNPEALARSYHSFGTRNLRNVVPFKPYPAGEAKEWSSTKAVKRVTEWADGDVSKIRQAFAVFDGEAPDETSKFKLPHHDIEDGALVTNRAGVIAAGNALMGSRGGVELSDADKDGAKEHLAKHYRQFDLTPPWEAEKSIGGNHNAAAAPQEGRTMPNENTGVLPAELAAVLKVSSVQDAVAEVSKRDLAVDAAERKAEAAVKEAEGKVSEANTRAEAATKRAEAAEKELADRKEQEAVAYVDALIRADGLKQERRESALRLARLDLAAFRESSPLPEAAPMAYLFQRVVPPEPPSDASRALDHAPGTKDPIGAMARQLQKEAAAKGEQLADIDAFNRAFEQYSKACASGVSARDRV